MSQEETNSVPTILDYLNEDCWRLVLQYVPVKDIILSERVSRRWQRMVLVYLQRIRIGVNNSCFDVCYLRVMEAGWSSFKSWIKKPGPIVVSAYCSSDESFKIIGENCPYLEHVKFSFIIAMEQEQNIEYENFKRLRGVCFSDCYLPEHFVRQIVASPALEKLEISIGECDNSVWNSQFLTNIKSTNLKCFELSHFSYCYDEGKPDIAHFLSAADRFSELTKFVLLTEENNLVENLHLLLEKMPKLEYLEVNGSTPSCEYFFKSVCKLRRLKYLNVDYSVCDQDLEALARSCPELRFLYLGYPTEVTGEGLQALCALTLEELNLEGCCEEINIEDDAVVDFIRSCPSLKVLQVRTAYNLTVGVVARAAAARRDSGALGPLRLNLYSTPVAAQQDALESYEELILEFDHY